MSYSYKTIFEKNLNSKKEPSIPLENSINNTEDSILVLNLLHMTRKFSKIDLNKFLSKIDRILILNPFQNNWYRIKSVTSVSLLRVTFLFHHQELTPNTKCNLTSTRRNCHNYLDVTDNVKFVNIYESSDPLHFLFPQKLTFKSLQTIAKIFTMRNFFFQISTIIWNVDRYVANHRLSIDAINARSLFVYYHRWYHQNQNSSIFVYKQPADLSNHQK